MIWSYNILFCSINLKVIGFSQLSSKNLMNLETHLMIWFKNRRKIYEYIEIAFICIYVSWITWYNSELIIDNQWYFSINEIWIWWCIFVSMLKNIYSFRLCWSYCFDIYSFNVSFVKYELLFSIKMLIFINFQCFLIEKLHLWHP